MFLLIAGSFVHTTINVVLFGFDTSFRKLLVVVENGHLIVQLRCKSWFNGLEKFDLIFSVQICVLVFRFESNNKVFAKLYFL